MAKIMVTENELKQIISESVKEVMNENIFKSKVNYGKNWEDLTPIEKNKIMTDMGFDVNSPNAQELAKNTYNKKRDRKINKGKAIWTADQYNQQTQQFETEIENLNNTITNRDARIKQLTGLIQNISNLLSNVTLPNQNIQEDSSQGVANVTPETNIQNITAKINYLIGQANKIPGLQQNIRNLQVANNELQNRINQSIATAQLNKTQPQAAAIRQTTQAQANPAAQRTVATTAPVAPQGRPTA